MNHPLHPEGSSEALQPGDDLHVSTSGSEKREAEIEPWMNQLKAAYVAGYYKTESALGNQLFVPWLSNACGICQVVAEYRGPTTHACPSFVPANQDGAQAILEQHRQEGLRPWWRWFKHRGQES